jgi:hypothetical protein
VSRHSETEAEKWRKGRKKSEKTCPQTAFCSITGATNGNWTEMSALDYIATRIAPKFGVSAEVIAKRLRVEKLWPPS